MWDHTPPLLFMTTSAGVIITDGKAMLGLVPFGQAKKLSNNLDIPKGNIDEGETDIDAAVRECKEETGLILQAENLDLVGKFDYNAQKQLVIYIARMKLPKLSTLKCTSFLSKFRAPEVVGYRIVEYKDIENSFFPNLSKVIIKALSLRSEE